MPRSEVVWAQALLAAHICEQLPSMASGGDGGSLPSQWMQGPTGKLSPWSLAKVWALHAVNDEYDLGLTNLAIAAKVKRIGGGCPTEECIRGWRLVFDADPDWYPGKAVPGHKTAGRKKVITAAQENAIAKVAMALKASGAEPTAAAVKARCPKACLNPETGEAFSEKVLYQVFRSKCYDHDPSSPWSTYNPKMKTALTVALIEHRLVWAQQMLDLGHRADWYFRHCVWMDPCSTIIHSQDKQKQDAVVASYGKGPRWMSADARDDSRNTRASPYAGKQCQWGDIRVWWFVVLCQGVVQIQAMPEGWRQNGVGQAFMVSMLPGLLEKMLGRSAPRPDTVFTDRGPGLYHPSQGTIVPEYMQALEAYGFKPFAGEHAKWQPPDLADVLLHETAVAWIRQWFKKHPPKYGAAMSKNRSTLEAAFAECAAYMNENHDVEGLCKSLPRRLRVLKEDRAGDRLKH